MKLIIHPGAVEDIREEVEFYESIQPGLGIEFMDEVDSAVDTVLDMPLAFPERRKNIRVFVFARFPFSLLYRPMQNTLEVLVVRHHSRHEDYGIERV